MASSSGSRVSSEHDTEPTRLSALYQYHNAPEVAPAHGLEHDDTIYPVSDKFPVLHERKFGPNGSHYTGKHAYNANSDNKPPRIIFGMKVKTFLVVATVMVLVIVGAAVGGAVGGKNLHQGTPPPGTYNDMSGTNPSSSSPASSLPTQSTSTSTSTSTPTSLATYSAAEPTYTPLSGCPPSMDNTTYTSTYASPDAPPPVSGLTFTMHCDTQSPLATSSSATQLAAAFVYSFADCVEVCAGVNWQNAAIDCTVAVYQPGGKRPANCWVGSTDADSSAGVELRVEEGTEVAVLVQ